MVKDITFSEFEEKVLNSDKPVLVDFWASWCPPCRIMEPEVEALSSAREDVEFFKVNVDAETDLAQKFLVLSIPTFILFQNGIERERIMGVTNDLEAMLPEVSLR